MTIGTLRAIVLSGAYFFGEMPMDLLQKPVVFINQTGENDKVEEVLQYLSQATFLTLAEDASLYARGERMERFKTILAEAAEKASEPVLAVAKKQGLNFENLVTLEGRFPKAVIEWLSANEGSLLLKQPVACGSVVGCVSKGDIKLTRESPIPVLLLGSCLQPGQPVLVGVAPHHMDQKEDDFCVRLIQTANAWATILGSELHVLHAWDLWLEGLIKNKIHPDELELMRQNAQTEAEDVLKRVIEKAKVEATPVLQKGDPTKVVSQTIDELSPGLVVLGSTAKSGIREVLLGNTAETIARTKQKPILIVR